MIQDIALASIRADSRAQPRTSILTDKVSEYVEDMGRGDAFPPLIVFRDDEGFWLADGFHRYHAAIGLGVQRFACDVRHGGIRDAILFSCGANSAHGVRRTNEDKRRAVMKLLEDEEWSHWNDQEIARRAKVSHTFVGKMRDTLAPATHLETLQDRPRTVQRGSAVYVQNTANIGKAAPAPEGRRPGDWTTLPRNETPSRAQVQHERDLANTAISAALWDIEATINGLPSANEAIARFPTHHQHTLSFAKLDAMAVWLRTFADGWRETIEESANVAAE